MAHQLFDKADLDGNNVLEKNEIKKILKQMQMKIDNKTLNAKIEAFDTDKNGTIDKKEFETFIQSLLRKKELSGLFKRYSRDYKETDDEPVMTAEELVVFYKEEQKMTITQPEAVEIILQIKKGSVSASQNYKDVPKLSFYDFGTLIFSNWNLAFNPEHTGIYMVGESNIFNS
jgi:Ca2+-binding EF-hand superfamily protein